MRPIQVTVHKKAKWGAGRERRAAPASVQYERLAGAAE